MKKIIFGEDKNLIHSALKEIRLKKGLTQSELAAKLRTMNINIDRQMISKIEKNDRYVTDYEPVCIAKALGVDIKDLLGC